MRLLEAIFEANRRFRRGGEKLDFTAADYADALPLVALTCIDARLNHLFPDALGVPEDKFIWLRNAGNIITGPHSSTMRSLALACAIKGGREIAVIGHTDCLVGKSTMLQITDRFKALGVERSRLPENLVEFFGLFASERQNVLRGVDYIRQSPLIGPKIPVHGFLIDLDNGRLEWVANGYQALSVVSSVGATAPASRSTDELDGMNPGEAIGDRASSFRSVTHPSVTVPDRTTSGLQIGEASGADVTTSLPALAPLEIKPSELKIGNIAAKMESLLSHATALPREVREVAADTARVVGQVESTIEQLVDLARRYKVIGSDMKQYGPITGQKLVQWLAEGRIDADTPAQHEGAGEWKPLRSLLEAARRGHVKLPPPLSEALKTTSWTRKGR